MEDCANLYLFFQNKLRNEFTEPPSEPQCHLVEMFTSCDIKDKIIHLFSTKSNFYYSFWDGPRYLSSNSSWDHLSDCNQSKNPDFDPLTSLYSYSHG